MNDSEAPDARLRAMEERLTFQQQAIDDLHEVVLRHEQQLEAMSRELARLTTALGHLAALAQGSDLPHEKPPHY